MTPKSSLPYNLLGKFQKMWSAEGDAFEDPSRCLKAQTVPNSTPRMFSHTCTPRVRSNF